VCMSKVGHYRTYLPDMAVYLVIFLQNNRICTVYMVLANPTYVCAPLYICVCLCLFVAGKVGWLVEVSRCDARLCVSSVGAVSVAITLS